MLLVLGFAESSNASEPIFAHEQDEPGVVDIQVSPIT